MTPSALATARLCKAVAGFLDPSVFTTTTTRRVRPEDPTAPFVTRVAAVVLVYEIGDRLPIGATAAELVMRDGRDGRAVAAFAFDGDGNRLDAPVASRFGFVSYDLERADFDINRTVATNARVSQAWRADRVSLARLSVEGEGLPFPSPRWRSVGPLSAVAMPYVLARSAAA